VLAAADLNDTFASKPPFAYGTATPSTTVEGFIWYDENDTPPTAKFWDESAFENIAAPVTAPGLVLVSPTSIANSGGSASATGGEVTFSGVTSISLNGVFTSDYENYLIVLRALGSVEYTGRARLRAGGTDNTTANSYVLQFVRGITTTASAANNINNLWDFIFYGDATAGVAKFEIYRPNIAATTFFTGTFFARTDVTATVGGYHTQATAYDGITFFPSTGNITGTVRVYGLKNS
jgi:hypothetical protein